MQYVNYKPAGFKETADEIVEVKLWEAFLLYNRHHIYRTLATYALDNGPVESSDPDLATVTFRFTSYDWINTLKDLLSNHNIPVIAEVTAVLEY